MEDLEKRKQVYGICGECNEPGTGEKWCQPCNAKRFKDNFKNWTSGNKDIDEFIQQSQLNSVYYKKYLEWIPFEKFQDITYIAEGGFGKIYSAKWPEGHIEYWDIENQKWHRRCWDKYALKSLNNSSNISSDFLNEIKSHLQIHLNDVVPCYGITQNPNTKEYMMVLFYCNKGNLRNYLNKSEEYIDCKKKIYKLQEIARGLLDIHIVEKVHKDFHSGNILESGGMFISDLGMCQPANKKPVKEEGIYGVLPYMAPEVLRGHQYTKAADIYSFGIIMNEFLSEEIPYGDTSHDEFLAVKICKGQRPKISEDVPKLLADLIVKCWDAGIENRPTAKELYQTLKKYYIERDNENSELYSQLKECNEIGKRKFESRSSKDKSKNIQTHPQAIYTSRLLNFKNLPKPVNSSDLSSLQFNSDAKYAIQSTLANPISECFDVQLSESELNEICQDGENNIES
ncbi:kinase-like domain-containing protein [Rhizophagus irregularis DAOM 181602=DAOM 197198]|uniref:Kinase-like domain-containing protein n=1 Tax=Rhizophagus irregularis (strain DAOM 181602 / DAOM 197198 / MUCL 43194) TaxID=747089 RepID=A0A2P4PY64_RHIID|nr:kinase-like domain-containing protein [Rhizophagus irregularis DAOM 181602=DAOM 197198]POG70332.1 kinase-like domain-containing protein [Rhizophagus irregularis DAOM 181602=DAOM 197198]|eukprot:XP_025177198.1 kinase-like domain-containing protein [Rhizophagus irregularis DAOM 181602=DAOM 197198]